MHILIIGAGGMLGRKLVQSLLSQGELRGQAITQLTLADIAAPDLPAASGIAMASQAADLSAPGSAAALVAGRPDTIVHLAAIVSGEAEADFEKGYRVNLDGTRSLFEAIRAEAATAPYRPRVVFTSSIAVYGAPFPERIDDTFFQTPLTSYGTQKAIGELLLADYSRRGIFDGIGIRLPTVCVRPGAPNKAASGFFSNILREPLSGREAVLPVSEEVRHWFASPRAAVGFLLKAAAMDLGPLGPRGNLNMPGLSATVGEEIEALRRIGGEAAVKRIRRVDDPTIAAIVAGWPSDFDARRALDLGFRPDAGFDDILRIHVEDELGGRIGG